MLYILRFWTVSLKDILMSEQSGVFSHQTVKEAKFTGVLLFNPASCVLVVS